MNCCESYSSNRKIALARIRNCFSGNRHRDVVMNSSCVKASFLSLTLVDCKSAANWGISSVAI